MRTSTTRPTYLLDAVRGLLPWLLLMLASATGARAVQASVESIVTPVEAEGSKSSPSRLAADLVVEDRSVVVLVSFVDARGNRAQFHCSTAADRVTTDSLFLSLEDVPWVAANLRDAMWT